MVSRQPQDTSLPNSYSLKTKVQTRKAKGKESESLGTHVKTASPEKPWEWVVLTDTFLTRQKPIFTKDGRYFFVLAHSAVKIYASATGEIVSTLSQPSASSHGQESPNSFSCATLNPRNPFQIITGSLNGNIAVWDFLDARLLQSINVSYPIHHICAHESVENTVFISAIRPTTRPKRQDDNGVVLRVSLIPSEEAAEGDIRSSSSVSVVGKTRAAMGLAISSSGKWLVAIAGHKAYVSSLSNPGTGFTKYVSPEWLTCLAFHPTEDYFATGDEKGVIRVWYCLDEHSPTPATGIEKKAQTTTFHWHAHPVSSLSFTANGAYLLSGGEEAVLVIWQLQSGKKEFVPRLGAPISTIALSPSTSSEEYLIGLSDSTFVFVNSATLRISRSYARIKLDPMQNISPSWTPLATQPINSMLILPSSHQSSLQIYSPSAHKLTAELEVSPSNRVSRRDSKPIVAACVERVAVSTCGRWLATVDTRLGDDDFQSDICLKFWSWDSKQESWVLNTRIDRPHGKGLVSSMSFRPSCEGSKDLWLATCGEDGKAKIWRIRISKRKKIGAEEFWVIRSTITFKSAIPIFTSWSQDGSALAISFGAFVVVYDPNTNIAIQTMSFAECAHVASCHFVGTGGRYLVCRGIGDIVLWDLISQRVRWNYRTQLALSWIVPHTSESSFAVFHSLPSHPATKIAIFSTQSQSPLEIRTLPFALRNVIWYPILSSGSATYSLVGITHNWDVVAIGNAASFFNFPESQAAGHLIDTETSKSIFQDIFGKSILPDLSTKAEPKTNEETRILLSSSDIANLLDSPTYLIRPTVELFDSLMQPFLLERTTEPLEPPVGLDDDDVEMEDETAPVNNAGSIRKLSDAEMDSMISLFKRHALDVSGRPYSTNGLKRQNSPKGPAKKNDPSRSRMETPKRSSPTTSTSTIDSPVNVSGSSIRKRKATS